MEFSRYVELLRATARGMLAMAEDAPVRVQSYGALVSVGIPAANVLLGEPPDEAALRVGWEVLADQGGTDPFQPARFHDTFGFSRPVYHPFLVHLFDRATRRAGIDVDIQVRARAGAPACSAIRTPSHKIRGERLPLHLWWTLVSRDEDGPVFAADVLGEPAPDGALHERGVDEQLDTWTFRELVAMHALARMTIDRPRVSGWAWERLRAAAAFHQAHTQPDYTTYQPWGIFTFILAGEPMFAEQQLHDATTQAHVEGGGAGIVPALILADAVAALEAATACG